MAISDRVGDLVCAYGDRLCQDHIIKTIHKPQQGTQFDDRAAGSEFLLAVVVFRCRRIWLGPSVADAVVGIGFVDDLHLAKRGSFGRMAADPISIVAELCCVSQCRRVVSK